MTSTFTSLRMMRTRWAAIGAAVAITLGAGGIGMVQAQIGSGEKPVTVTIEPRRVLDTRFGIGLDGVFTTNAPRDLQVTGNVEVAGPNNSTLVGTVVPSGASAALVNVTVVSPTHFGHLSLRPADATGNPTTANVNFAAGSVSPNAATIDLSASGALELWLVTASQSGTAHVVVDVLGYTFDHNHDDRYPTAAAVAGALAGKADVTDVYSKAEVYSKSEVDGRLPDVVELGVAGWSFVAPAPATASYTSGGCVYKQADVDLADETRLFGSIELPVGAEVTKVSAAIIDSSSDKDATLEVWVSDGNNGGTNEIGSVSTGGFPGFQRSWSQTLTSTVIGNGQFVYFEFAAESTPQLQLCGVQITYGAP